MLDYNYTYNYTCPKCNSFMVREMEWNPNCTGLQCDHCKHLVVSEGDDFWYRPWMTKPYGELAEAFIKQMIALLKEPERKGIKPENIAHTMQTWLDCNPRNKFIR